MKRVLLPVLAVLMTVVAAIAAEMPLSAKVQWLFAYDAEAGTPPDSAVWRSTYGAAAVTMADGALRLDHASPGVDGYQCYKLQETVNDLLTDPKGDPCVAFRIRCTEAPAPKKAGDFPGFFTCGFFGTLGEGKFGADILVSQTQLLFNFSRRCDLPQKLEVGDDHDFLLVLRRREGSLHVWMDDIYVGKFPNATMEAGKTVVWGDGSGGVCGKVAVTFIRWGLLDVSDRPVQLPGYAPYVPPKQVSGIIQNEDCTQYFYTPSFPATREGLERYLTECYLPEHTQIKEFLLNPQSQRASYESKVIPPSWRDMEKGADGRLTYRGKPLTDAQNSAFGRMMSLAEEGIDPYAVWIDLLRRRQISPWISLRMNDVHDALNENSHMHSDIWREHPKWRVAPYRTAEWFAQQLDYARPEVREYMLRLVDEVLERYDCDGLELDWMRFCRVFRYGHEVENRGILTEFIRQVRNRCDAAAARLGHPVKIAVRVQLDPVDAFNTGFDVAEWCRLGLVDIVIPAPFFDNNWEQCPVEIWRSLVGPKVLLAVCLDTAYKPERMADRNSQSVFDNALATYYLAHGADRIYLFNHFGNQRNNMRTLGSLEKAAAAERRHVPLYKDDVAVGNLAPYMLPKALSSGSQWGAIRLSLGKRPEAGRAAWLFVGCRTPFPADKSISVRLNGELLQSAANPSLVTFPSLIKGVYAWPIPDGMLFDDGNVIEFNNQTGATVTLDWVEIYIEPLN